MARKYIWKKVESFDEIPIFGIWSHDPTETDDHLMWMRLPKQPRIELDWKLIGVSLKDGMLCGTNSEHGLYLLIGEE